MKPSIVFDVNETLLDLSPVRTWFTSRFEDHPDASMWFGELLRLSFVSATTDRYVPFPVLAEAALATTAERANTSIGDGDISHIRQYQRLWLSGPSPCASRRRCW
jgi:2-haloacid dehalogenase